MHVKCACDMAVLHEFRYIDSQATLDVQQGRIGTSLTNSLQWASDWLSQSDHLNFLQVSTS